jgi:hypothetical protein
MQDTRMYERVSVAVQSVVYHYTNRSDCCLCSVQYLDGERLSAAQYNPACLRALIVSVEQQL